MSETHCSFGIAKWFHLAVLNLSVIFGEWVMLCPDWPQNEQCRAHFGEFLQGYRSSAESVEVRFPYADSTRQVKPCSVCFNDGFNKVLLMASIVCFIHELDACLKFFERFVTPTLVSLCSCLLDSNFNLCSFIPGTEDWPEEVLSLPQVEMMLTSFRWIRCSYTYYANPAHHFLHSLRAFGWKTCCLFPLGCHLQFSFSLV